MNINPFGQVQSFLGKRESDDETSGRGKVPRVADTVLQHTRIAIENGYYEGEVHAGVPHGKGSVTYTIDSKENFVDSLNGVFCKGDFINGKVTYLDGRIFNGAVRKGRPHGQGKMQHAQSAKLDYEEGNWSNGELKKGVACYKSGMRFEFSSQGKFRHGKITFPERDEWEYAEGKWRSVNGWNGDCKTLCLGSVKFRNGPLTFAGEEVFLQYGGKFGIDFIKVKMEIEFSENKIRFLTTNGEIYFTDGRNFNGNLFFGECFF